MVRPCNNTHRLKTQSDSLSSNPFYRVSGPPGTPLSQSGASAIHCLFSVGPAWSTIYSCADIQCILRRQCCGGQWSHSERMQNPTRGGGLLATGQWREGGRECGIKKRKHFKTLTMNMRVDCVCCDMALITISGRVMLSWPRCSAWTISQCF